MTADASGNVYIADCAGNAIDEWNAATHTLSTVISSGLSDPEGLAMDASGNIYIADYGDNAIKEWNPATQTLSTLVSSGLNNPEGVAVDSSGNVYIADTGNNAIKEWNAATGAVSTLVSSGLSYPNGVAVDAAGNVYITDTGNNALKELPRAFVATAAVNEGAAAGSGALAAVLPVSESLKGVLAPSSNASWLTIGSVSGGVVHFSFTQNTGTIRTAYITVLGQQIAVTQTGKAPFITKVAAGQAQAHDTVLQSLNTGPSAVEEEAGAFWDLDNSESIGPSNRKNDSIGNAVDAVMAVLERT
jgi:hypothetical protein